MDKGVTSDDVDEKAIKSNPHGGIELEYG